MISTDGVIAGCLLRALTALLFSLTGCILPDAHIKPADSQANGSSSPGQSVTSQRPTTAAAGRGATTTTAPKTMTTGAAGGVAPAPSTSKPPSAGSGGSAASNQPSAPNTGTTDETGMLPCDVSRVLAANCQTCHGSMPIGGAPMPLVTYEDLHEPARTNGTKKVYELVEERIHDTKRPMPPIGDLGAMNLATLDRWLQRGAQSATSAEARCPTAPSTNPQSTNVPSAPTASGSETCYELKVHGAQTVDTSPLVIKPGDQYEQFYFSVPWPEGTVATRFSTNVDNAQVLHHWFLFDTNETQGEGTHITAPLPTLIGTDPKLLAMWSAGGGELVAPQDVGFELPKPGRKLNLQWHFANNTDTDQADASVVQICTLPAAERAHIAAFTALGTEDLNGNAWTGGDGGMPAHQESTFTTLCMPGRMGGTLSEPIHILGFMPHMHQLGTRMQTRVSRMDGLVQDLFAQPFRFGQSRFYEVDYALAAGDKLQTSCTFNNDTDYKVPFGEASDLEMCYQFTLAYPAHALSNGAFSLLGWTSTCW